ncbi:hypothetical protein BRADI_1g37821v3 [Brachypodium distachyon]|uniref:Uncharacterized protein n=1 Tax=Brachypodium distachyon TaxID=15368 RepID=A0A2K2DNB4_BRADI|nr:hypothetical protein BRADI_1g37821v3 [Brachypodium distachyon]PNT75772.1 hypothetical protein BRADI_1g37821v3 [Brachypodium distachyon]
MRRSMQHAGEPQGRRVAGAAVPPLSRGAAGGGCTSAVSPFSPSSFYFRLFRFFPVDVPLTSRFRFAGIGDFLPCACFRRCCLPPSACVSLDGGATVALRRFSACRFVR